MDTLKWYFELVDQMSGPAKAIDNALKSVEKHLKSAQKAAQSFGASLKKSLTQTFGTSKGRAQFVKDLEGARGLFGEVIGGLSGIAGVGLGVAAAVGGIAYQFGSAVLEAMEFRDTTVSSFKVLFGSAEAASRHFARAQQLALLTPFDTRQVVNAYRQLVSGGFRETELEGAFAVVADMASASGDMANGLNRSVLVLSQIRSRGKLVGNELNQLAELGFGRNIIAPFIAARMGLHATGEEAVRQVTNLISKGRVSAETAIGAVMDVLRQRGGGTIGGLTRSLGTSLAGQISNIKDSFFNLIASLDIEQTPGLKAIKDFLTQVAESLNPTSANARQLQSVFVSLANELGTFLKTLNAREMTALITDLVHGLVMALPVVKQIGQIFKAFFLPFFVGFAEPMGALIKGFAWIGTNKAFLFVLQAAGLGLGTILALLLGAAAIILGVVVGAFGALFVAAMGVVTSIGVALYGIWLGLVWLWDTAANFFGSLRDAFEHYGSMIIEGLIHGINSGLEAAGNAITNLGVSLTRKLSSVFRIASPSRVMMELGFFVSKGFAVGIESGSGAVDSASDKIATIPTPRIKNFGGMGKGQVSITLQINASGDPDEIAQSVAKILPSVLVNAISSTVEPQET